MLTVFGTVLCVHNYNLSVMMFEAKMTLMSWSLNDCSTLTGSVKSNAFKPFAVADRGARFVHPHKQTVNQGQSIFGAHPLQGCGDRSCCGVLI